MLRNNQLCIRVALLLWFVMSSCAITVTSPSQGTTWSSTGEHTVSWTEVDTDPKQFAISLVQLGVFQQILVPNVDGTQGSVTFSATLPTGSGFQVNIIKSAQEQDTILAQSPQIAITSSGTSSTSTSISSSPSPSSSSTSSSASSPPNSSTSSSSTPASSTKSTNGAPGSTSGSPPSITPSASSPAPSSVSNGNSVNSPSSSVATFTLITTPPSPTSPNSGFPITSPATSSNSSTSSNLGATSSLVSLEPTSSGTTKSFAVSVSDVICFVFVLSNLWTLL